MLLVAAAVDVGSMMLDQGSISQKRRREKEQQPKRKNLSQGEVVRVGRRVRPLSSHPHLHPPPSRPEF